jgi:endoglucanase
MAHATRRRRFRHWQTLAVRTGKRAAASLLAEGFVLTNPRSIGQMNHFAGDDKMNIFRLPVGWQWLVNNKLGGTLDAGNLARYDDLVQGCLKTGAACVIDVGEVILYFPYRSSDRLTECRSTTVRRLGSPWSKRLANGLVPVTDARWNGGIIGQGGPTNDQFVNLWSQLAKKYAGQPKMMFGLMNEVSAPEIIRSLPCDYNMSNGKY